MRKLVISLLFGLVVSMLMMAYADNAQHNIASSLLRLHIVANSDSEADQAVKLKVRDAVIAEFGDDMLAAGDFGGAKSYARQNIGDIEKVAADVICQNGFDYGVAASVDKVHFPTKHYENITLPPGEYEALRIVLGDGAGQNWWCVMYPPLCFADGSAGSTDLHSQNVLESSLGEDEYALITDGASVPVQFKFKLLEIFDFVCR